MKRLMMTVLALVMVFAVAVPAMASGFDLSIAREYSSLFEITEQDDVLFVDTGALFSIKDLSFTHPYESDNYYSSVRSDLVIVNPDTSKAYPCWRVWVEYYGSKQINADKVTFTFNGKDYIFTVPNDDIETTSEGDEHQTIMIMLGLDNSDFMVDLEKYANDLSDMDESSFDAIMDNGHITMKLNGTDTIRTTLPNAFILDFKTISILYVNGGDLADYIGKPVRQTPLKVRTAAGD